MTSGAMPSYFTTLGHDGVQSLRRVAKPYADWWLKLRYPTLTPEERQEAIEHHAPDTTPARAKVVTAEAKRRPFVIAAWLCGASANQLSRLFGRSRQTIQDHLNQVMPPQARQAIRLAKGGLDDGRLLNMWETYCYMDANVTDAWTSKEPLAIALTLEAMSSTYVNDDNADDAYLADDTSPATRLGGQDA